MNNTNCIVVFIVFFVFLIISPSSAQQPDHSFRPFGIHNGRQLNRITNKGLTSKLSESIQMGLDSSFGMNGIVRTMINDGSGSDWINSVTLQPDGKILITGFSNYTSTSNSTIAVLRYNKNGALDNSFGTNGIVTTNINSGYSSDGGRSIAVQSDGKIVVAGDSYNGLNTAFAVVRYNTNGTLDNSFGVNGKVRTEIIGGDGVDEEAYSLSIQSDGKIVAAGWSGSTSTSNFAIAVARYNTDGTLDNSFGNNGKVRKTMNDGSKNECGWSVGIQSDGKIVVAGYSQNTSTSDQAIIIVRYNINGTLDNSFGINGEVLTSINNGNNNDVAWSLALESDGKILIAGDSYSAPYSAIAVARYNTDGTLDNSFGNNGTVKTSISGSGGSDWGSSIAVQSDGRIVVAGFSDDGSNHQYFTVVRYNTNGTLDNSFGINGTINTRINSDFESQDFGSSVVIQPNGKIIVAGSTSNFSYSEFAIARYLPGSTPYISLFPATRISESTAEINGIVFPFKTNTVVRFLYGTNTMVYTDSVIASPNIADGDTITAISAILTDLLPATTYYYRISGTSNSPANYFSSDEKNFKTLVPIPLQPLIISPNNISDVPLKTTFIWHSSTFTKEYDIQISIDSLFSSVVFDTTIVDTSLVLSNPLAAATQYFWHVNATNSSGISNWSTTTSFTTLIPIPLQPLIISPNNISDVPLKTTFIWHSSTFTKEYDIQISIDSLFSSVVFDTTIVDTSLILSNPLSASTQYFWHVSAANTSGTGDYSLTATFTTGAIVNISDEIDRMPHEYALYQNYPNPFNPATTIRFDLKKASIVKLDIYNILGQKIFEQSYGMLNAGSFEKIVEMRNYSTGIYYYRIIATGNDGENFIAIKRFILLK